MCKTRDGQIVTMIVRLAIEVLKYRLGDQILVIDGKLIGLHSLLDYY